MTLHASSSAPPMPTRTHALKRPWKARHPWQFRHAYGLKRSFNWFTTVGREAVERRLEKLALLTDGLSDESLARVTSYDGPWLAGTGAPLLKNVQPEVTTSAA